MSELIEDLMMLADKRSEDDPTDELGLLLVRAVGQIRGDASALAAKDARIAELEGLLREVATSGYSMGLRKRIDEALAANRLETLNESETISLEDMEARFGVEPATHSEEGREPIPDCCQGENCGTRTADHSPECISETERDIQEWVKSSQSSGYSVQPIMWLNGETLDYELSHEPWMDESTDWMALMTVTQHERILKAKEAEIARLNDQLAAEKKWYDDEIDELRAQPARQVGDEPIRDDDLVLVPRGLLGAARYAIKNKVDAPNVHGQLGEYCYGQAALAPAAVADEVIRQELEELKKWAIAQGRPKCGVKGCERLADSPWTNCREHWR